MKLQSNINYSSYGINQNRMSKPRAAQAPSFKGAETEVAKQAFRESIQGLNFAQKAAFRAIHWIGTKKEYVAFTTLVNAVGTAVVAPIMIVYGSNAVMTQLEKVGVPNPFKGKKKEDRVYSALKQPVSAVLAIALQFTAQALTEGGLKGAIKAKKLTVENPAGFAKACGIAFTFLTLVPQVKILNYLYPKFIKLVAPELAKEKQKPKTPVPAIEVKKDTKIEGGKK